MKFAANNFKLTIVIVCILIVAALGLRIGYGLTKTSFHVDEGITVGLTNGTWLPSIDTGYQNRWLPKTELENLVFSNNLKAQGHVDLGKISASTASDVHPPLYYWLYTTARFVFGIENYVLSGVLLNSFFFLISCFLFILLVKRLNNDPFVLFAALACFVFSSATISLTMFLRMYELLQTIGLFFLFCAAEILFPRKEKQTWTMKALIYLGLFLSVLLGMLTQYYFLFLLFPVGVFALVYLPIKKRPLDLLFGLIAIVAGLFLALQIFPAMQNHLTASYRAGQSVQNLVKSTNAIRFKNLFAYLGVISNNMVHFVVWIGAGIFAFVVFIRKKVIKAETQKREEAFAGQIPALPFFLLVAFTMVFTILIVSFSSPYQTVRYIGSFMPIYALAFVSFVTLIMDLFRARIFLAAGALLVLIHGVLPMNLCHFHEDYVLDKNPIYFQDNLPVLVLSTKDAYFWKNMLPYMDIPDQKEVYVTSTASTVSIDSTIRRIAKESKIYEFYALVDDYFQNTSLFKKVGYYGFYNVLKVKLDPNYIY